MALRRIALNSCVSSEANCACPAVTPLNCIQSTAVSIARGSDPRNVSSSRPGWADSAMRLSSASALMSLRPMLCRRLALYSPRNCHTRSSQGRVNRTLTNPTC